MVKKTKGKDGKERRGARKISGKELKDVEELVLPYSKLKYCSEQLQNLNYIFTRNLSEDVDLEYAKALHLAKSVTERLIQRLLCGVGVLDSRFASKFLISLQDRHNYDTSRTLKYLIRLDSLSKPSLYPADQVPKYSIIENDPENCPPGYARLRLHASSTRTWADFVNSSGFLRRDKVQAKMVELLAIATSGETPNSSLYVDDSVLCGSPGKVVDAFTLHNILRTPPERHVFYGAAGAAPRFPDPRDFKLAIVDEPSGIRLKVGFLSPALASVSIEVFLLVAIGLDLWPSSTDFPFRVPLGHSDAVLYHKAAQTGMYLTGFGVQSSAWQIRLPAAELILENHYSPYSTTSTILRTLFLVLRNIYLEYGHQQFTYKILSKYVLRTGLLYQLEKDPAGPTDIILNWSPKYLSTHVLRILDSLIHSLKKQRQPNYFFPEANLFINPGHLCEDDFILEANKIHAYMLKLFDESLMSLRAKEDFCKFLTEQKSETALLNRWKELVDGLMPPPSTRGRRICFAGSRHKKAVVHTQYTTRQLEYIGILLKNMLLVKQTVLQATEEFPWALSLNFPEDIQESPIEDIIYILVTLIEQARDKFLESLPENSGTSKSKLKRQFDLATSKLVELARKEKDVSEPLDDINMVKTILKWLYKGLDQNKKSLAPVLRPYLRILFATSHGASWHLEALKQQDVLDEIEALGTFAKLVNAATITPAQGLVDSIGKNWNWAKAMLKVIEQDDLRLVFVPARGQIIKHILSLPKSHRNSRHEDVTEMTTLSRRHYLGTILIKSSNSLQKTRLEDFRPPHCTLRDSSSMSVIFSQLHRNGEHRCCGDVLQTILAMQKINVLQEVTTLLPNDERGEVLEALQKLSTERRRTCKKKNSFVQLTNSKVSPETGEKQKYTPKEESAGIREEKQARGESRAKKKEGSLIGSVRAARIRDDTNIIHFQDNFKIQSLMKHSSFKY